jgi:acylphosphatase
MNKGIEIVISGIVQGVGFRAFTRKTAREMGLKGYVKNLPDGRVYVHVEGDEAVIEKFVSLLRQGPASAIVKSMEIKNGEYTGQFQDFQIRF